MRLVYYLDCGLAMLTVLTMLLVGFALFLLYAVYVLLLTLLFGCLARTWKMIGTKIAIHR